MLSKHVPGGNGVGAGGYIFVSLHCQTKAQLEVVIFNKRIQNELVTASLSRVQQVPTHFGMNIKN